MGRHRQARLRTRVAGVTLALTLLATPVVLFMWSHDRDSSRLRTISGGPKCVDAVDCAQTVAPFATATTSPTPASPAATTRPSATATATASGPAATKATGRRADATPKAPAAPSPTRTRPVSRGDRAPTAARPAPVPLDGLVDNDGIAATGRRTVGFDGRGFTYPEAELPAGIRTIGGAPYRLLAGEDNVVAGGQAFALPGQRFAELRMLTAASFGPAGGTATIRYADGRTVAVRMQVPDWLQGGVGAVRAGSRNTPSGERDDRTVNMFVLAVPLDPRRAVASLRLPVTAAPADDVASMHVFAVTLIPAD